MACFAVPGVEAIVVTAATQILAHHEKKKLSAPKTGHSLNDGKIALSRKLSWLQNLLWGGSALLAFEHVWHGEVVPFAPFLTAASDPASLSAMLHEMGTVGVGMAVAVTAAWGAMVATANTMAKRERKTKKEHA